MPSILIAECIHEVCSFNPVPTRYDDFSIQRGQALFDYHRHLGSEVGGALSVLGAEPSIEMRPTFGARGITSGGTIAGADFGRLAGEFLGALRQAGPVDGAYLALHGAMASTREEDPEGYFLQEARKILGEDVSIVASFDLHGILTDRMLEHADATVVYHTYPHVDFFETGQRSARLLLRLLRKEVRPVTARVAIPALVRGDELITGTGAFGQIVNQARQIEQGPGGLSAGMFIGNPFTDVPDLCCDSVVVLDGDANRARREALRLAGEFWEERHRMQARLTALEESVRLARGTRGTVVMMDAADATSSGASGDSNAILVELIRGEYRGSALAPVVDAAAVGDAVKAGVGATIQTRVGGSLDAKRFRPLQIQATVRMLSDGRFRSESFGQAWFAGTTAVLQADNVTLVVTSRPVHLYDRSLFLAHGLDPRQFDLVVVKSPHCQPHMYADWCARLINVDAPGSTSANLPTLGYTRCRRPIFPLDAEVPFAPVVRLFSRQGEP
jgi:microcystin degradation protein MlrC